MKITDEILTAYLDGELAVDDIADVARQIDCSPELARRIKDLRRNDASVAQAYQAIDSKPMPAGILDMLDKFPQSQGKEPVEDVATVLPFKEKSTIRTQAPIWQMAMAASVMLFVGLGAGRYLVPPEPASADNILAQQNTGMIGPENNLFAVLESQPSAVPVTLAASGDTVVLPSMTFKTGDNRYCRAYSVTGRKSSSQNVACRVENAWVVKISVGSAGTSVSQDGLYQTASGEDNPAVTSVIRNLIKGDALDADDEQKVMKQNWR
ncbi:hypothetical protein MNBD_ALPHA02-956 [hydrothermal vent metagenome]|uniref:Anti sigma-E protein RseA N-terminal domain-containing protein n=1 Tax=hydrothermal vent metagenome TaxID=652676 RepID=A0A3B0R6B1_9ZZZZ